MILTDKPRKKDKEEDQQGKLPAVQIPSHAQDTDTTKWHSHDVTCYFLENQDGPQGFEKCTLLTISLGYFHTGYMEQLNQHELPKGSFYFDKANNRFFLKHEAVEIAKKVAKEEYRYSIVG